MRFRRPTFSEGRQKLTETRSIFLKKDRDGHTLKVRQSREPLNKRFLEHFEKWARGCNLQPPSDKMLK